MGATALKMIFAAWLAGHYTEGESYIGLAVRDSAFDTPKVILESPIGVVGYEYRINEDFDFFVQHVSGVTDNQDGMGLNLVGIKYKFK